MGLPAEVPPAWLARERAQDKLYAVDPLVAQIAHLRTTERHSIDPTVLTEMQLGMSIRRQVFSGTTTADNDEFLFHVGRPLARR